MSSRPAQSLSVIIIFSLIFQITGVISAWRALLAQRRLPRSEIEERFCPRNHVYLAAIFAAFPGVTYSDDPVTLFYTD